jgi:DNA-binding IclR family transcriptional regulator
MAGSHGPAGAAGGAGFRGVPAARNALAVLREVARQAAPVPAAALARQLQLPRSTVYHLLAELTRAGFVVHLPEERRYGLGPGALELGTAYMHQEPLARLGRPVLARLVDAVGQSAHLAVLHGREVLYVVEERAQGRPPLVTDVGVRLPAQLTASGRAILAGLPAAQVRALFPDPTAFVDRHGAGPTSLSALRRLLVEVRRAGVGTEEGDVTPGFASVACAVRDHTGRPAAAVAVTFPGGDLDATGRERVRRGVVGAAAELARRIGGPGPA